MNSKNSQTISELNKVFLQEQKEMEKWLKESVVYNDIASYPMTEDEAHEPQIAIIHGHFGTFKVYLTENSCFTGRSIVTPSTKPPELGELAIDPAGRVLVYINGCWVSLDHIVPERWVMEYVEALKRYLRAELQQDLNSKSPKTVIYPRWSDIRANVYGMIYVEEKNQCYYMSAQNLTKVSYASDMHTSNIQDSPDRVREKQSLITKTFKFQ